MMSLCMLGLYAHAWRRRDAAGLDAGERARTAGELAIYVFYVAVATLSIVLASWAPRYAPQWIGAAGVVYAMLGLTGVVESLARRRALARSEERRVGKQCVRKCCSLCLPIHSKKKK